MRSMLVHLLTAVYYNPHGKGKVRGRNKWAGIVDSCPRTTYSFVVAFA